MGIVFKEPEHRFTYWNTAMRIGQMAGAIATLVFYATPLRHAANQHKYTDAKFVGSSSPTVTLS